MFCRADHPQDSERLPSMVPLKIGKHHLGWEHFNGCKLSILSIAQKAAKSLNVLAKQGDRDSA
jgi:hypothetical protein